MNDTKVVFFDIDGTLYLASIGVPESTLLSIEQLKQNNIKVVLCTGRARAMIPESILNIGFDAVIAGAGTYLSIDDKLIYSNSLDSSVTKDMITNIRKYGFIPVLEGHEVSYYDAETDNEIYKKAMTKYFIEAMPYMEAIPQNYDNLIIGKASAVYTKTSNETELINLYKDSFTSVCHGNVLLEFIPKNTTKASGIKKYLELTGISLENTYAYGDSMNDLEMLQYVKYGVAMGNSSPELKEKASYITSSISEDGIYNSLKEFGLI